MEGPDEVPRCSSSDRPGTFRRRRCLTKRNSNKEEKKTSARGTGRSGRWRVTEGSRGEGRESGRGGILRPGRRATWLGSRGSAETEGAQGGVRWRVVSATRGRIGPARYRPPDSAAAGRGRHEPPPIRPPARPGSVRGSPRSVVARDRRRSPGVPRRDDELPTARSARGGRPGFPRSRGGPGRRAQGPSSSSAAEATGPGRATDGTPPGSGLQGPGVAGAARRTSPGARGPSGDPHGVEGAEVDATGGPWVHAPALAAPVEGAGGRPAPAPAGGGSRNGRSVGRAAGVRVARRAGAPHSRGL